MDRIENHVDPSHDLAIAEPQDPEPLLLEIDRALRVMDDRIDAGYAATFALGMVVKILLVQIIVVL